MAPIYKVAVVQLYPKPMQAANNFKKAAAFVRAAAAQGAQLVVLPEYHLTNFLPKDPKFRALCSEWKTYLQAYQDLAKECNICIVPGTIVQTPENETTGAASSSKSQPLSSLDPSPPAPASSPARWPHARGQPSETGLLNVTYFISNDGSILGSYTKKNLWGPTERNHLASSNRDSHPAFDTPLGKVGLLVCWDLAFPEAFRELIAQGAKLVIIPTFWTLSDCSDEGLKHNANAEALFVDSTLSCRAFENTAAIVFANAGGPPGRGYMGLSQVVMPFVGPVARLGSCAEGMSVVDIDMAVVEEAEKNYNIRGDLGSQGWHYDYRFAGNGATAGGSKL